LIIWWYCISIRISIWICVLRSIGYWIKTVIIYNGIWRYASIADMNRIIGANVTTALLNFVGTTVFLERLPNSYYIVGAALQYFFICIIRFSYRFLRFKKKGIIESVSPSMPVIIIGNNISNSRLTMFLEENSTFRPIAFVDKSMQGKSLNGKPVTATLEEALDRQAVNNVVVVDPLMPDREKEKLRVLCENKGIKLHDYSWLLMKRFQEVMLTDVIGLLEKPYKLRMGNQSFDSIEEAMEALEGRYSVVSISGNDLTVNIQGTAVDPVKPLNNGI